MSSFTKFDAPLNVTFNKEASRILKDEYYMAETGFIFYLNYEDKRKYVRVDRGFLSDGASIPKPFRWLLPRWGKYGQAAVLHDKLCETFEVIEFVEGVEFKRPVTRFEIDAIFYLAMDVLEVNKLVSGTIRTFVDLYRIIKRPTKPNVNKKKVALEREYAKK